MIEISEQADAKKGVESLLDDKHVSSVLIVGSHGSGKSELSKYANELAAKKFGSEKAISIEAYSFCNDYIASIRFNKQTQFFERFSGIGFLCLENLDALSKKEATQNALCRVLDSLISVNCKILFTSETCPSSEAGFTDAFVHKVHSFARFPISSLSVQSIVRILRHHIETQGLSFGEGVLGKAAVYIQSRRTSVGGIIQTMMFHGHMSDEEMEKALEKIFSPRKADSEWTTEGSRERDHGDLYVTAFNKEEYFTEEELGISEGLIRASLEPLGRLSRSDFIKFIASVFLDNPLGQRRVCSEGSFGLDADETGLSGSVPLDEFGLLESYIEVKRFISSAGLPDVQKFVSNMVSKGYDRGIFVNLSGFSEQADRFARGLRTKVRLISGESLAKMAIVKNKHPFI